MRRLLLPAILLLASCTGSPVDGINSPLHAIGNQQVGWQERKANDGDPLFVVKSIGPVPYDELVRVAERHAQERCPQGYRVIDVGGADQPTVDILNPHIIIGSELRFEVQCFERNHL